MKRDPSSFIVFAALVGGLIEIYWFGGSGGDALFASAITAILAWTVTRARWDGSRSGGVWFVRIFEFGVALLAPWPRKWFSERNGFRRMLPLGGGWRIEWLRRNA